MAGSSKLTVPLRWNGFLLEGSISYNEPNSGLPYAVVSGELIETHYVINIEIKTA